MAAPDAVHARVVTSTGTAVANLRKAQGIQTADEHNTSGAGSIDVHRYDDVETRLKEQGIDLWAPGNQVVVSVGAVDTARIILDQLPGYRIDPDTKERIDVRAGTLQLGLLNSGMVVPEYGWRPEATEERTFDYGSNPTIGGWFVSSEWHVPVGVLLRSSWRWTHKKRHLPKGFKDRKAQWLWWRSPDSTSSANETNYFVGDAFTLSQARKVKIWVAGDDTLEFQVDGEVRATTGPGGWKKASTVVLTLSAGTHYVAAKVTNTPGSTGNQNRSGFIYSIGRLNGDGDVVQWIQRSTPSTVRVRRELSEPPGWYSGQILRQLVAEQQARGCAGHSLVTFGFTTSADSRGAAWTGRRELSITVGTQALDYTQQLVETGIDVAMTPGLQLNAWISRGTDRSATVRLDNLGNKPQDESAAQVPMIRNFVAAKASTGWVTQTDAASVAANGLRETMAALGGSQSPTQTAASVSAMMPDQANPPQTIEVKFSGATTGVKPYVDFNIADWVSYRASGALVWERYRVMAISMEVDDAGFPVWTLQLYKD